MVGTSSGEASPSREEMDGPAQDDPKILEAAQRDTEDNDGDTFSGLGRRLHLYFSEHSHEYRRLTSLRKKGWESAEGDEYFKRMRHQADQPTEKARLSFYHMTQRIAREVHESSRAFKLPPGEHRVLDIGMAPGGFLKHALDTNSGATAIGITLPAGDGGHIVMLPKTGRANVLFMDVTMLAEDLGVKVKDVPHGHPDADKFLTKQLNPDDRFGLVLCGGVIVRTQDRADYRQYNEARRLEASQVSIGLEHLNSGGTMIMVMHKLESWRVARLLWRFRKFCDRITVVKPSSAHTLKSSFYVVAQDVQIRHPEAIRTIEERKNAWKVATFGGEEDDTKQEASISEVSVETVLTELGQKLLKWGEQVWRIQADALQRALHHTWR